MSTIISVVGQKLKVILDSTNNSTTQYPFKEDVVMVYNQSANTVDIHFKIGTDWYLSRGIAIANLVMNGVTITSQAVFETQLALMFGNTPDSTSAASTQTTLAAASASGNGADNTSYNNKGVVVVVDVTAITGTSPSLVVNIQGKDPASGKYYTILSSAAISTVSTTVLTIYPGIPVAANSSVSGVIPRTWRIAYTIAGTTPAVTATIGACTIS